MGAATAKEQAYCDAIIVDATSPLAAYPEHLHRYLEGGITVCTPTVGGSQGPEQTLPAFATVHRALRERKELMLVRTPEDFRLAKSSGRLGLLLHIQGADPLGRNVELLEVYWALGLRIVELCYNVRNRVGDGSEEASNAGLSAFGISCVRKLNELNMVVDCAHTGVQTTLDAIRTSRSPVIISHGNPRALHRSRRNLPDEQLVAIAGNGGVIGVSGFPAFLGPETRPTVARYIEHLKYLADLVGIDHVGLGLDNFQDQHPLGNPATAELFYQRFIAAGDWSPDTYPKPPWYYPAGIETPDKLPALLPALREGGFSQVEAIKILGGNWLRVFDQILGAQGR
ncbi:dipeptidase [Caenimonas soli]|uniref:dipeptidase n=1 Tax=Caenimonas soli TaxID=2735555 RepID=UPI001556BAB1|nr:membrane dipeptidase [Caenimonas soli]NPC58310.1 peptidase M19 [Caenimonas soli]